MFSTRCSGACTKKRSRLSIQKRSPTITRSYTKDRKSNCASFWEKYNQAKGAFAEYLIIRRLRHDAHRKNDFFKSITCNLPEDFRFVDYRTVWSYKFSPLHKRDTQIDVFARSGPADEYSVIGEVKSRDAKKFSGQEARRFLEKIRELVYEESVAKHIGFVFSISGFTEEAVAFMEDNRIAWSDDDRWLGD